MNRKIALPVKGEIAISFDFAIRFSRGDRVDRACPEVRDVDVGVVALVAKAASGCARTFRVSA